MVGLIVVVKLEAGRVLNDCLKFLYKVHEVFKL